MQLGAVIVYVEEVGAAVDFYRRAFGLEPGGVTGDDYSELQAGSRTVLAFMTRSFAEQQMPGHGKAPAGFEVALVADDVPAAFEHAVREGAEPVKEPAEMPWGQVVSYVRAPDGTLVEICSEWH